MNFADKMCSAGTASEGSSEGSDENSQNVSFIATVVTNFMQCRECALFVLEKDTKK